MRRGLGGVAVLVVLGAGCGKLGDSSSPPPTPTPATQVPIDGYLSGLPTGAAQKQALCARGNQDRFSNWYCGANPSISSLEDVLEGLQLKDPANPQAMTFAMNGNSMSVVGRFTTSLNPRVVVFSPPPRIGPVAGVTPAPTPGGTPAPPAVLTTNYTAVGFARGNELVEVASFDPVKQDINFFLLRYGRPCDPNCPNSDLFMSATESGWTKLSVYGEPDLHDTPLDCMACHQPGGTGTKRILRMQERTFPWMHWFSSIAVDPPGPGGASDSFTFMQEFLTAHPGETYGGIPFDQVQASAPFQLESLVEAAGFAPQPNEFDSSTIQGEGRGPTWLGLYANAVAGLDISPPFYQIDPFDPGLLADATNRYAAVLVSGGDPVMVPDMSALFPVAELGDLGFQASSLCSNGTMVVQHRCGFCHNGLYPGISRNAFDVHKFPNGLSEGEREAILTRIRRPASDPWRMPPSIMSDLTEAQIEMIETSLGAPHP